MDSRLPRLIFVAMRENYENDIMLVRTAEAAIRGGFDGVMLRDIGIAREDTLEQMIHDLAWFCLQKKTFCMVNLRKVSSRKLAATADAIHLTEAEFLKNGLMATDMNVAQGVSIHSVTDAMAAERAGADYVMAGNIYETFCKPGKPGQGLQYLREICHSVSIPVYAIGGINHENISEVIACGAYGAAVSSAVGGAVFPAKAARMIRRACEQQLLFADGGDNGTK